MDLVDRYRNFGIDELKSQCPDSLSEIEDLKLQAFEDGYKAGWEDLGKVSSESDAFFKYELKQNLMDISFTFHEARLSVFNEVSVILSQMLNSVLPEFFCKTLGYKLEKIIENGVCSLEEHSVEVAVSEEDLDYTAEVVGPLTDMKYNLVADNNLNRGEARVKFNHFEYEVSFQEFFNEMSSVLDAYIYESTKATK